MRSRAFALTFLVLVALLGGVTADSVAAATSTTVTWNVLSLKAGQVKELWSVATTNSPGAKTWSSTGSCTLSLSSSPKTLTMGSSGSCTLTLDIAQSGQFPAKTSIRIITLKTIPTTVTWNVSSMRSGQVKELWAVATTNSPGVKTWSKTGSCTLSLTSSPKTVTMGSGASCTLTLNIDKSGRYPEKTSLKTIVLTSTPTPATGRYRVGDPGPGGGTIFHVDMTRAIGNQYFEAACVGWWNFCDGISADPRVKWGCHGLEIRPVKGTAIGDGEVMTNKTVAACRTVGIAARLAADYSQNGISDWFLPSGDELNKLYLNRARVGGFSTVNYWSSSEYSNNIALSRSFFNGGEKADFKYSNYSVRPIRSF